MTSSEVARYYRPAQDEPGAAGVPGLLSAALAACRGSEAAALVVLAEDAATVCGLSTLCEARRRAGLRASCLAGPLGSAADHLADLLSGARPTVTLLPAPRVNTGG